MSAATELTRRLVALDTTDQAESVAAALVAPILEDAGFTVDVVEHAPGRGTLIADWSTDHDVPPLCLSGHLDTVPLGATPWQHDPLAAEPDGDRLLGRGTSDMKGGVAAIVAAAVATATARGRAQRSGLRLLLTAAEETGSAGARAAAAHLHARPTGPVLIAEPTANSVAYGHKGALWLTGHTRGVTAHGSMPWLGTNAVTALARAAVRLADHRFPESVAHPVMGAPTLNLASLHGGLNINSVPDRAELALDVRTVAGQRHDEVAAELASCAGPDVRWTTVLDLPPVWTDPDEEWAASVRDVVADVTGERPAEPTAMTFFTDAAVLAPAFGSPVVICGPGEPGQAHATDEWCSMTRIDESVEILHRVCRRWCGL